MNPKPLLTPPSALEAPKAISGMLYGQPGSRKTTTALSSPNPVLLDFDQGLHRVKPQYRVASLQISGYDQVLALLDGDELKPYDTVVIDTAGKLVDRIAEYVIRRNPKNGNGKGSPSQQGWGEVGIEFKAFVKMIKDLGKSVIFVAHESEEKNGEDTIKRPAIAGRARKDVVMDLDFMGYVELRGNKPIINFNPTDKFYAKNSLDLDEAIVIPDLAEDKPNDFLSKYVFKANEEKLAEQAKLRVAYESLLREIDEEIAGLKSVAAVNKFYGSLPERETIWDSFHYTRAALQKRVKELGLEFDKGAKAFIQPKKPESEKTAASVEPEAKEEKKTGAKASAKAKEKKPEETPAKQEIDDSKFSV